MRPSDAPNVDRSHDRYGTATPCSTECQCKHQAQQALGTTAHQCRKIIRGRARDGSSAGRARAATAHRITAAAGSIDGAHQPTRSFFAVAHAERVAQTAHQPRAASTSATVSQRRQRVPLRALARKLDVLRPHAAITVEPLRAKVVRGHDAQVGSTEGTAASRPCAVGSNTDCPSPAGLIEGAANDASSAVHVVSCLQAFDAHARAVLNGRCSSGCACFGRGWGAGGCVLQMSLCQRAARREDDGGHSRAMREGNCGQSSVVAQNGACEAAV